MGVGYSALTRNAEGTLGERSVAAAQNAALDAGIELSQIDGLASFPEAPYRGAGNIDGMDLVSVEYMLRHLKVAPEVRWYAEIEEGMILSAVVEAVNALLAGACSYALVWRALHQPGGLYGAVRSRYAAGAAQFQAPYGLASSFQPHALAYQRYMSLFGATRAHMASLATSQRANANKNERAYFYERPMTHEDYMNARMISDPLCLYDCDIPVEGAVAVVLTTADRARGPATPSCLHPGVWSKHRAPTQSDALYADGLHGERALYRKQNLGSIGAERCRRRRGGAV